MKREELIKAIAADVVIGYMDSEIEFCDVYDRDDVDGFSTEELKLIHQEACSLLSHALEIFEYETGFTRLDR